MRQNIDGILLLDKPAGITSNRALQNVKFMFNAKKAGHTGSLDPLATGMLPICFGKATKFAQYLLNASKTYLVEAHLGVTTTTGDSEGNVITKKEIAKFSDERLSNCLQSFVGELSQIPPMYSAIKHEGKPLYTFARRGIEIERKPRLIHIFEITLNQYSPPILTFSVRCSKGTYVRTLVEDIGQALECGAYVCGLRRLSIDGYDAMKMQTISMIEQTYNDSGIEGLKQYLLPVDSAVELLPMVTLSNAGAFYLRMGQSIRTNIRMENSLVRLVSEDRRFLGLGEIMSDGWIRPHRLL